MFVSQATRALCRETFCTRVKCLSRTTGSVSTPKSSAGTPRWGRRRGSGSAPSSPSWHVNVSKSPDFHPRALGDVHQENQNGAAGAERPRDRNGELSGQKSAQVISRFSSQREFNSTHCCCCFSPFQHVFVSFLSRNTTYKFLKSVCLHLEVFVYPNVSSGLNLRFYLLLAGAVLQCLELSLRCWKLLNSLDTFFKQTLHFFGVWCPS